MVSPQAIARPGSSYSDVTSRVGSAKVTRDWEVAVLGSLVLSHNSGIYKKKELYGRGSNIIGVADFVNTKRIDGQLFDRVPLTSAEQARYTLRAGNLLYCESSLVREGIARTLFVTERGAGTAFAWHTRRYSIDKRRLNPAFLNYFLQSESARHYLISSSIQTALTGINTRAYLGCPIVIPSLAEQNLIVEVLSDADALIDSLEKIVEKKRLIKRGAMQDLLSGRRRLPGFEEQWIKKKVGDFTNCAAGGTPSTLVPDYWGGDILWMSSGELHSKRVSDVQGRITEKGLLESSARIFPPYSVLIGLAGQGKTRGTVALNLVPLATNQSIAAIFPNPSYSSEFLYHNLSARYDELRELSAGDGGRGGLNLTLIRSIPILFPPLNEQTAIARTLDDLDAELEALEARLEKARQIKQGMMQELLTGRVRLV